MKLNLKLSEKQKAYWNGANCRWNIKCGATRSGKTYLDYFLIPKRIRSVSDKPGLVIFLGNTKGTLQRNVIEPMQAIYGAKLVGDIRSDNTALVFGQKVHCLGADNKKHVDRLRGSSAKYIYGDEIVSWNAEVFEMVKSRLDKDFSKFDGTCNPGSPTHWLKKFVESDADLFYQQYSIHDNSFLSPKVKAEMEKEHTGVFYKRYILGEWSLADGLVYPNFSDCVVDLSADSNYADYQIACDYGIYNPTCFGLFGLRAGRWYMLDEYSHSGRETSAQKTDEEYYSELVEFAGDLKISRVIVDPSASSFITLIRRRGKFRVVNAKNDVIDGIRAVSTAMNRGLLNFSDTCKKTAEEMQSYCWDEKSDDERPLKQHDHFPDLIRYFVYTNGIGREKTKSFAEAYRERGYL